MRAFVSLSIDADFFVRVEMHEGGASVDGQRTVMTHDIEVTGGRSLESNAQIAQ